jgi:hypothetical protein
MTLVRMKWRPLVSSVNETLRSDALPWDDGRALRRGSSGGSAPVNTVAPVASGTVTIGGTLSVTDGTWTGSPSFTYQWRRAGANIGGATSNSYTPVAADIDDTVAIDCVVTAVNAFGSASQDSNNLSFAPDTAFPDTAIGVSTSGLTLADGDTTVDQWAAAYGGKKAEVVLSAPAATNRPAYSATGGPGSRPMVTGDGVDNVLRDTTATFGGTWAAFQADFVGLIAAAGAAGDRLILYGGTTGLFSMSESATQRLFGNTTSASISSTGTTAFTTTHRQGTFDWDGANQSVRVNNGAAEDTDASTHVAYADGSSVAIFGGTGGTNACNASCLGWALTRGSLTSGQKADLRAFFSNKCGIS